MLCSKGDYYRIVRGEGRGEEVGRKGGGFRLSEERFVAVQTSSIFFFFD